MIAPSTPSATSPISASRSASSVIPPGRHDRAVGLARTRAQQVEVGALEHAVLVDVGDHVAGAALGVEARQHVVEVATVAGPAAGGQRAPAYVEPDRDPVTVGGDRGGTPLGLLERGGADVDPAAARLHRRGERVVVADAAAHLHVDVEGAGRSWPAARGCVRARRRRRGRRGGSTPRPPAASAVPPRPGRRSASPSPATPCTSWTACPPAMSTAGSSSRRRPEPVEGWVIRGPFVGSFIGGTAGCAGRARRAGSRTAPTRAPTTPGRPPRRARSARPATRSWSRSVVRRRCGEHAGRARCRRGRREVTARRRAAVAHGARPRRPGRP